MIQLSASPFNIALMFRCLNSIEGGAAVDSAPQPSVEEQVCGGAVDDVFGGHVGSRVEAIEQCGERPAAVAGCCRADHHPYCLGYGL